MQNLLDIEETLGRVRSKKNTPESRIIDIDIVFIEDMVIDSSLLEVPHPKMQNSQTTMDLVIMIIEMLILARRMGLLQEPTNRFAQLQEERIRQNMYAWMMCMKITKMIVVMS